MKIEQKTVNWIYSQLADDLSRRTFLARLQFSSCPCDDTLADLVASYAPSFVSEVRSHIAAGRKIAVYGAGNIRWHPGRMVYQMFESHSCGLFDKNADSLGEIYLQNLSVVHDLCNPGRAVMVKHPKEILHYLPNATVIIAVFNRQLQIEIFNELLKTGFPQENLMFCSQLFDIFAGFEYFNMPFHSYRSNEVFLDCGCFDGDDSIKFLNAVQDAGGSVKEIIAFEPSARNYKVAHENLSTYENATVFPYGLGETNGFGYFFEDDKLDVHDKMIDGMTDVMTDVMIDGSYKVEVRKIDDIVGQKNITFIKMDIEGSEFSALKGAEKTLRRCKPKLAICLYHKPEDIIEIPGWLLNLDIGYKIYIRHHSFNPTETILYAV